MENPNYSYVVIFNYYIQGIFKLEESINLLIKYRENLNSEKDRNLLGVTQ